MGMAGGPADGVAIISDERFCVSHASPKRPATDLPAIGVNILRLAMRAMGQ
jgi:hypothetical protein